MLVIDENNLKLLKMKEKLLEVSTGEDFKRILMEYEAIIKDIDQAFYKSFIERIKNISYHGLPLKEQLKIFIGIDNEYNEYNEFQCKYKRIFESYSVRKLILSPITTINIDAIRNKINAISGYLVLLDRLEESKKTLESLNLELATEEKKNDGISERFIRLEEELKDNFLKAEGRAYNSDGEPQYTSVVSELKANGIDVRKLLTNSEMLKKQMKEAEEVRTSEEEKRVASEICYNSMPNISTRQMYRSSLRDATLAQYKVILLEIVDLISKSFKDYGSLKKKRERIKSLLEKRTECLEKLDIRLMIDPFDRIKLDEQMEILDKLGDTNITISNIRSRIQMMVTQNEEMTNRSHELLMSIDEDVPFVDDKKSMSQLVIDSDVFVDYLDDNIVVDNYDKRVVNIKDTPNDFMFDRANQKTKGVISKVNDIFNEQKENEVEPILVSEPANEIVESTPDSVNEELFNDVKPFNDTVLFEDKFDDAFVVHKKEDSLDETKEIFPEAPVSEPVTTEEETDAQMPEIFWGDAPTDTAADDGGISNEKLSFDEQIDALMGHNDDNSNEENKVKTRKLVA